MTPPKAPTGADPAQAAHLAQAPWITDCGCRTREDGRRYFRCRRRACTAEAQVCGGYCRPCFDRIITNRPINYLEPLA